MQMIMSTSVKSQGKHRHIHSHDNQKGHTYKVISQQCMKCLQSSLLVNLDSPSDIFSACLKASITEFSRGDVLQRVCQTSDELETKGYHWLNPAVARKRTGRVVFHLAGGACVCVRFCVCVCGCVRVCSTHLGTQHILVLLISTASGGEAGL